MDKNNAQIEKPQTFRNNILPWMIPILILVIWQASAMLGFLSSNILPSPIQVISTAFDMTKSGQLIDYTLTSARRALLGFLIGGSIGFLLGLSNGISKLSAQLLDTSVQMLRNIPILAILPLIILWCGIGEEAKVVMVALGVFFPIYLNTYHGIRSIDPGLVEMGRVYGLNQFGLLKNIIFPGALQSILVGVRYALGIMWLVLIAAETIATDSGIGYMAMNARELMQMDVVILSIIIYALLGKLSDAIAQALEKFLLRWNPAFK